MSVRLAGARSKTPLLFLNKHNFFKKKDHLRDFEYAKDIDIWPVRDTSTRENAVMVNQIDFIFLCNFQSDSQ